MISATQYNKIYDQHCQVLKAEAKRIADSSVARSWLNKNLGKTDPVECLEVALRCLYDLTGDETMLTNAQKIQEARHDILTVSGRPKQCNNTTGSQGLS